MGPHFTRGHRNQWKVDKNMAVVMILGLEKMVARSPKLALDIIKHSMPKWVVPTVEASERNHKRFKIRILP